MHILITGAAGALGSALARHLVASNHQVTLVDRPVAAARLAELSSEIGAERTHVLAVDLKDAAAHFDAAESRLGPLDGAALIAGAWGGGQALHLAPDDAVMSAMWTANVETAHTVLRLLLPRLVSRSSGSVVVIGSRAVLRPETSQGAAQYAASKAALVCLAQVAAAEVLAHKVRVNAVLPSTIDTPANRTAMPDADYTRWVSTGSLAEVISFLLSDGSRDVSGAVIPVYGAA